MAEKIETKETGSKTRLVSLETGIGNISFGGDELLTEEQADHKREALRHFQAAYEAQMQGDLDVAADLYKQSLEVYPTAEAHTFLGWTYSFMGLVDEAIEECHRAIEVDPDFGNPYNDIGAYLIEKGDLNGAVQFHQILWQGARPHRSARTPPPPSPPPETESRKPGEG